MESGCKTPHIEVVAATGPLMLQPRKQQKHLSVLDHIEI